MKYKRKKILLPMGKDRDYEGMGYVGSVNFEGEYKLSPEICNLSNFLNESCESDNWYADMFYVNTYVSNCIRSRRRVKKRKELRK